MSPKFPSIVPDASSPKLLSSSSERRLFFLRPFFLGAREDMTFGERSRTVIQNAGAWAMVAFGVLFMVLNAAQGTVSFVGINSAFLAVGALSLWLASKGFDRTAPVVLIAGSCLVFFFAGIWLRNEMDNFLLVTLAAALLLLDQTPTRWALAAMNGAAFLYAKILLHDGRLTAMMPPLRYGLNILTFLFVLAGIIEFFRVLNSDYLRTLEQANRRLAEANQAKERLFSVIAHDLRGPVGNLKASLEMLGTGTLSSGEFEALVSDLTSDVEKTHVCLENTLSWAATQLGRISTNPQAIAVHQAVGEAISLIHATMARKYLRFSNDAPEEALVFADAHQFQAILRNLLSNAAKFTAADGNIRVKAEREGDSWILCVEDTGVGMTPERVEKLFPTEETDFSPEGSPGYGPGLGLKICRDFTRLNGGRIFASSVPSKGTQVFVRLPAAASA